jgi:hypothetical protein
MDLLPCPFCTHIPRRAEYLEEDYGDAYAVHCDDCGMRGPYEGTEEGAVAAWKKQPPIATLPLAKID